MMRDLQKLYAIRDIDATEGKTCVMREACSSSSPKAAAISFTYSRCGYVYLGLLSDLSILSMIMEIITRPCGTLGHENLLVDHISADDLQLCMLEISTTSSCSVARVIVSN
jgi:hypothetical protein